MPKVKITQKQLAAWNAYVEARKTGKTPTTVGIAAKLGISPSALRGRLNKLEAKGLIHVVEPYKKNAAFGTGGAITVYAEGPCPRRETKLRSAKAAKKPDCAAPIKRNVTTSATKKRRINRAFDLWVEYNDFRKRYVCPTISRFSVEVDLDRTTVKNAFILLVQEGYIVEIDSGCATPIYERTPDGN